MASPQADLGLAYRLLCAANLAYGVTGTTESTGLLEVLQPILPTLAAVEELLGNLGFIPGSIHAHQSSSRYGIDAYLYGETEETAILAFRGTLPMRFSGRLTQILGDWLNNTQTALVEGKPLGIPGQIHEGYAESLENLWHSPGGISGLLARVAKATAGGRRLLVTGHSKGGALAALVALRLAETGVPELTPAGVFTFGAPRAGNLDFAAAFQSAFGGSAWRFEYQDDIVPHLPPSENFWLALQEAVSRLLDKPAAWPWPAVVANALALKELGGYAPVGQLQFIDWNGRLRTDDTAALRSERREHLTRTLTTALLEINRDHLPMRGYGYMNFLEASRR
ncbi:MAG: lipase family protein [Methylococcaceae bacterium]|nr:lipase family protein [Methylococcaceae bacterium]